MRFVVVGPGAMGSVIGAALAQAGHEVSLLGRASPQLDAIRDHGLTLTRLDGSRERVELHATAEPSTVIGADAIIILVKSGDTATAVRAIRPYVAPGQIVLTLQNGLGNAERIREELREDAIVLVGVTSQAATRTGPGRVTHTGEGATLVGYLDTAHAPHASALASVFAAAGLPAASVPDISRWIWRKLALNAAINGLTALGGFRNGCIATDHGLLDSAESIAEEAAAVARALGIELGGMRGQIAALATATAANRSSMLQDLDAGRPTEVGAIHEAILAAGEEAGIAIPAVKVIAALIRARERNATSTESNNA